jgi:hypothetical protein
MFDAVAEFISMQQGDSPEFIDKARAIAIGVAQEYKPARIYVIRIDNWFGPKWLHFAGKFIAGKHAAIGVHKTRLHVPPFVPNRVVSQEAYSLDEGAASYGHTDARPLHLVQPSRQNLTRFIDRVTKSGVFIWFSGGSEQANIGSIMVYVVAGDSQSSWYASFQRGTTWKINKVAGLSNSELLHLTDGVLHEQDA